MGLGAEVRAAGAQLLPRQLPGEVGGRQAPAPRGPGAARGPPGAISTRSGFVLPVGRDEVLPSHQVTWVCSQTLVERLLSSWKGPFCTSMLVGERVLVWTLDNFSLARSPSSALSHPFFGGGFH